MLSELPTVEKAAQIIGTVVRAREKYGVQASFPYRLHEVVDAVLVLQRATQDVPSVPAADLRQLQDDLTLARRQLGACKARYARLEARVEGDTEPDFYDPDEHV